MKKLLTGIWIDPFGSMSETPKEQIERVTEFYREELGVPLDIYLPRHIGEVKLGTDLLLFDYGGAGLGNSLLEDNSRDLVKWAIDNPNSLVVVISAFTYNTSIKYEIMEELKDNSENARLPNIVVEEYESWDYNTHERKEDVLSQFMPKWFLDYARHKEQPKPEKVSVRQEIRAAASKLLMNAPKLPAIKFFNPKERFFKFMARKFSKQNIFDIGAGIGHIAAALKKTRAFKNVLAIDTCSREMTEFPIYKADACAFPYPPDSVIMVCRPCHGLFVEDVVENALNRKVSAIMYVGLSKNVKSDLGRYYRQFKKVAVNVGADKENIWVYSVRKMNKANRKRTRK